MEKMETTGKNLKITLKVDNYIRNYCNSFLSYLYISNGWKRTMFDIGKDIFIPSSIPNNEIRILITNVGSLICTCYCVTDILKIFNFLEEQFEYGNMKNYLIFDDQVVIKTEIEFSDGDNKIKSDSYDKAIKCIEEILYDSEEEDLERVEDIRHPDDEAEKFILSILILWFGVRLVELF